MPQDIIDISDNDQSAKDSLFSPERFVKQNRLLIVLMLIGFIIVGLGVFFYKNGYLAKPDKIEVLDDVTVSERINNTIIVELSGAVEKPGVYTLPANSRVEDLLIAGGGLSGSADREWLEKMINRAAKLNDGQKLYIPSVGENSTDLQTAVISAKNSEIYQTTTSGQSGPLININTSKASTLETLWGIGPVLAKNIIEHRPYSSVEELLTGKIIKQNVYDRIKGQLTVY